MFGFELAAAFFVITYQKTLWLCRIECAGCNNFETIIFLAFILGVHQISLSLWLSEIIYVKHKMTATTDARSVAAVEDFILAIDQCYNAGKWKEKRSR